MDSTTEDFLMRSMTFEGNGMSVTRTRNSRGYAAISLRFGDAQITFEGDGYQEKASELARLLDQAANHTCAIPALKEKP